MLVAGVGIALRIMRRRSQMPIDDELRADDPVA